ncbi:MAG: extracellular solute-binding protein [Treponema sp.]|nr:extracellular solute-binding protein [Treponema sp.]
MKKFTLLVAAIAVLSLPLFAAGTRQRAASSNDVRLRMVAVWNGGYQTPPDQYNNPVAKAIREKIGVTVEIEGIMMNEVEKLNLMFASGDLPDIVNAAFWGGSTGESGIIKKAASEGMLLPIDDMLEKYPNVKRAYDIGVISQKYLETDLSDPMFGGKKYLIPQETAGNTRHTTNWMAGVFVRGDVPKALGIDETSIKTPEQLYDFMKKAQAYGFKDVNGNPTIVATTRHNGWDYAEYVLGFKKQQLTDYYNINGTVTHYALTDDWINRNLYLWRMVSEGLLDKECFTTDDSRADEKLGNGTALMVGCHFHNPIDATKRTGLFDSHPEMRFIPIGPMNDVDGKPLVQVEAEGRSGTPVIFFPKNCKDLDAAFRFIDFVNTPEGRALCDYGIEGETMVRNAQGQPRYRADLDRRAKAGDASVYVEMRDTYGIGYIPSRLWYGDLTKDWFGEDPITDPQGIMQEAYKKARPIVQFSGWPINAYELEFPEIQKVMEISDSEREKTYRERAYFAATEAEARRILTEWQTHLRTAENGLYMRFLDFLTQKAKTRSDIVF